MAKGKKPGVMIYFETKHIVKHLDLEDIGRLFLAILDYAEENKPPNFSEEGSTFLDALDARYPEKHVKEKLKL